jgi:hypothetical protein
MTWAVECRVTEIIAQGGHHIVVGEVIEAQKACPSLDAGWTPVCRLREALAAVQPVA